MHCSTVCIASVLVTVCIASVLGTVCIALVLVTSVAPIIGSAIG